MNTLIKTLLVIAISSVLFACGGDDDDNTPTPTATPEPTPTPEPETIVDVAVAAGNFTTLITALEATDLDEVLDDPNGTFTVFAPTDDAFALLGQEAIAELLTQTETLSDILLYHVISGSEVDSTAAIAAAGSTVEMANGDSVGLSLSGDNLLVNLSMVTTVDIAADNGVIHVIDAVLMPPADAEAPTMNIVETAVANGSFTTLVAALGATDLDTVLSSTDTNYTVFAPTDAAFDALGLANVEALLANTDNLTDILQQHVISGSAVDAVTAYSLNGMNATTAGQAEIPITITGDELRFGGAEVVIKDIHTTNGIIHVIDTVVVAGAGLPKPEQNIAEVATNAGSFSILLQALVATGLDATLTDENTSFTVFAPTDAAFEALGQDTLDALLANPDQLSDILLYHVVSGAEVLSDAAITVAASADKNVMMANEDDAVLTLGDDGLFVNTSLVTSANVMASNGVIHVIDSVMMPPAEMTMSESNIVETAIAAGNFTTLVTALQAASLDGALADEDAMFTVFAPTDAAFAMIDNGQLASLIANTEALTDVLSLHVVAGAKVSALEAFALNGTEVSTLGGDNVAIEIGDGVLKVGDATVSTYDIYASNGVIHVIDAVILGDVALPTPLMSIVDVAEEAGSFTTLIDLLETTGLDATLDNFDETFTVFAPTDAAFAALGQETLDSLLQTPETLSDILLYHVISGTEVEAATAITLAGQTVEMANGDSVGLSLSGDNLLINLATVTTTDVQADNGVIHVIDAVITPPSPTGMMTMNIVQAATTAGNFTTLISLLEATDLDTALADETKTYTVFAPTDAAFELIPAETLASLQANIPDLTNVLLQHVIEGAAVDSVTAFSLAGTSVDTMANEDVSIEIVDGELQIQGATVSTFDLVTNNGTIHVIDAVITETLN